MREKIQLKMIILCFVSLITLQIIHVVIPPSIILIFQTLIRPMVFALLTVLVVIYIHCDFRHSTKEFESRMIALFSIVLYATVFIVLIFLFGGGTNSIQPGVFSIFIHNAWTIGATVVLGAIVRYKLVHAGKKTIVINLLVTVVFTFEQLNILRNLIHSGNINWGDFIFSHLFPVLVTSAVITFFANKGGILSVIVVSAVFKLTIFLTPVLPRVSVLIWNLIVCAMLFVVAMALNHVTSDNSRAARLHVKRAMQYEKKGVLANIMTITIIAVIIAFFFQLLPIYPVIVLTGSMEGTYNRGSVVFIQRIPSDDVLNRVDDGTVIHFRHRDIEIIHRVIGFEYEGGVRTYRTKGDANDAADPFLVSQDDVIGRVLGHIPFVGYPYLFFREFLS